MNKITISTYETKVLEGGLTDSVKDAIFDNPLIFGDDSQVDEIKNVSSDDTYGFLVSNIGTMKEIRENTDNEDILALAEAMHGAKGEYYEIRR